MKNQFYNIDVLIHRWYEYVYNTDIKHRIVIRTNYANSEVVSLGIFRSNMVIHITKSFKVEIKI